MKYYSISEIDDDTMPVHFKDGELPFSKDKLEDGFNLKVKPSVPTIYLDDDVVLKDWASVFIPVISKRFLDLILQSNSTGLEYFPVNLVDKKGVAHEYFVLNYIPVLEHAMDKKSSKIIKYKSKLLKDYVAVPSIIEKATKGLDIFRLEEVNMSIFVTDNLRKVLKKNKITGIDFDKTYTYGEKEK